MSGRRARYAVTGTGQGEGVGTGGRILRVDLEIIRARPGSRIEGADRVRGQATAGDLNRLRVAIDALDVQSERGEVRGCERLGGSSSILSPAQVTLTSGGSATATLTIGVTTKPAIIPLSWETYRRTLRRNRPLVLLPLLLFAISATWWWMIAGRRQRAFVAARAIAWPHRAIFFLLLFALLGISSCGGGATSGGGGGGGGTVTVTNVTVQGTSGGTSVTLGSISVTIR